MRPFSVAVGRTVAAVAMVLLWRNDMWLLVGAGTAATFVLVRRWLADRVVWRPMRVALLALHKAEVTHDRSPAWTMTVPDLVVEARGRTTVLDRAGDLLRGSDDLRRWAVGAERLALASRLIADTAPFLLPSRRRRSAWTLGAWAVITGLAAVTVASGGGGWAPIAYVAAFTATTAALTDLREERRLQPMLVERLAGDLPENPYANRTHRPPGARRFAETAASEAVLRRAIRIVEHSSLGRDQRSTALEHLEEARGMLPSSTGRHPLNWLVLHVPYAVAGWVTWSATG